MKISSMGWLKDGELLAAVRQAMTSTKPECWRMPWESLPQLNQHNLRLQPSKARLWLLLPVAND